MSTAVFLKKEEYKRWIFFSVLEVTGESRWSSSSVYSAPEVDPWHTLMQIRLPVKWTDPQASNFALLTVKLPSFVLYTLSGLVRAGERLRNLWTIDRAATDWIVWVFSSVEEKINTTLSCSSWFPSNHLLGRNKLFFFAFLLGNAYKQSPLYSLFSEE